MIESIGGGWGRALCEHMAAKQLAALEGYLADAWSPKESPVYPRRSQVFRAFEKTPLGDVRAVVLGQDPYPTEGQACGLAFSVPIVLPPGTRRPLSLRRILTELRNEEFNAPENATLERWTTHVLLLNSVLTYSKDGADRDAVWKPFTTAVIQILVERSEPIAFLLWGKRAQAWVDMIRPPHKAICSPHPAARGRAMPFAGSCPFSRANAFLGESRKIDWALG
jgi:uracil-DNA glycosylase